MKKILLLILTVLLIPSISYAALTTVPWRYNITTGGIYPYPSHTLNVGIGTTTPNASLDIDSGLSYLGGYVGAYRPAISSGSIGDEIGLITNDDKIISAFMANTNKFFYGTNDGLTGLTVGGTSGYVGVGTSSPENTLDVWGGGAYIGNPAGGSARLYAGTANDSVGAGNETGIWTHDSVYGTNQIAIFDNTQNFQYGGTFNAPGIAILGPESVNANNVGIQTTTPGSDLSVNGNMSVGNSYMSLTTVPSNSLAVEGSLGVGIAVPTSKLHVVGGSAWIQNAGAVSLTINDSSNSQVPNISLRQNSTQKAFIEGGVGLNSRLDLGTGASTRVITINSSSVGISEQSPASKLSVSGNGSYGTTYDTIAAPTNGLIVEGNLGVGTSTPLSKAVVQGTAGVSTTDIFIVSTSTNATLFAVNGAGNIEVGGGTPTLSANCGTSATITTGSTDTAGSVTLTSTGAVNACTINFAKTRLASPISAICNVGGTYCYPSARSTTAVTFTFGFDSGGLVMDYLLIGQ